ncbi:MAG: hypothetical protein R3C59_20540 [Planctomycetaceae bacterium]
MLVLIGFCLAQTGVDGQICCQSLTLPTAFLTGAAAAGGIALINSLGNIGGFLGAQILGFFGPWAIAACLARGSDSRHDGGRENKDN